MKGPLDPADVAAFHRDGFVVRRGWFDGEEMELLARFAGEDPELRPHHIPVKDNAGRESRLTLWNHPGDDLYGMFSRCRRVVDAVEQLLDDEVYHYHAKMMLKEPRVGGAWEWHQDYGYWYQNGCLFPDMLSVMIAVDRADRENGCLEVPSSRRGPDDLDRQAAPMNEGGPGGPPPPGPRRVRCQESPAISSRSVCGSLPSCRRLRSARGSAR